MENALNALIALLKEPRSKHIFKNDGKGFWADIKEAMTLEDGVFLNFETYTMADLITALITANETNAAKLNDLAEAMTTNIDIAVKIPSFLGATTKKWFKSDSTTLPKFFNDNYCDGLQTETAKPWNNQVCLYLTTTLDDTQYLSIYREWSGYKTHKFVLFIKESGKSWQYPRLQLPPKDKINLYEAALWALITLSPMPNEDGIDATLRAAFVDRPLFIL